MYYPSYPESCGLKPLVNAKIAAPPKKCNRSRPHPHKMITFSTSQIKPSSTTASITTPSGTAIKKSIKSS